MMKLSGSVKLFPLLFAAFLALSGCDIYGTVGGSDINIPGGLPFQLQGEWVYFSYGNPSDSYTITDTEIIYHDEAGDGTFGYAGTIRFISNFDRSSGVIIIEYTIRPAYDGYNGNDFFAIYYRNLTANTMQMANSTILPDNNCPDVKTLDEAVGKFTRMQMGKYVNWSIVQPYEKQ
ncbi:hypothetical protein LQZ19_03860 [Treponema primitia]|uniref:hypothetical protein n=1 Tax=Treponema primitia TaxID=88058 RepID=UPI00397F9CE1